jgi:hypothetical protein
LSSPSRPVEQLPQDFKALVAETTERVQPTIAGTSYDPLLTRYIAALASLDPDGAQGGEDDAASPVASVAEWKAKGERLLRSRFDELRQTLSGPGGRAPFATGLTSDGETLEINFTTTGGDKTEIVENQAAFKLISDIAQLGKLTELTAPATSQLQPNLPEHVVRIASGHVQLDRILSDALYKALSASQGMS